MTVNIIAAAKFFFNSTNGLGNTVTAAATALAINANIREGPANPSSVKLQSIKARIIEAARVRASFFIGNRVHFRNKAAETNAIVTGSKAPKTSIPKELVKTMVALIEWMLKWSR